MDRTSKPEEGQGSGRPERSGPPGPPPPRPEDRFPAGGPTSPAAAGPPPPPPRAADRRQGSPPPGGPQGELPLALPARAAWLVLGGLVGSFLLAGVGSLAADAATRQLVVVVATSQALLWTGLVGTAWLVSRRYGSGDLRRDYGFRFRRWDPLVGVGVSLLMRVAAALVALALTAVLSTDEAVVPDQLEALEAERAALVLAMALAVVGAPLVEELFFRGLVLQVLRPVLRTPGALVAQALLFGLVHATATGTAEENLVLVGALSGAGLVLGLTVERAGRLGPAVWGHAFFNLLTLVVVAASW